MKMLTSESVRILVQGELKSFVQVGDVEAIEQFLVEPWVQTRGWDYSKTLPESFPVWVVAEDKQRNYALLYSEHGFGPEAPWGIAFTSDRYFGMDSAWYPSLYQAFRESWLYPQ